MVFLFVSLFSRFWISTPHQHHGCDCCEYEVFSFAFSFQFFRCPGPLFMEEGGATFSSDVSEILFRFRRVVWFSDT